ncbi:hypothetical protein R1flu_023786 [Riccia fluitans]|uniref:Uncharacterized protein n=1 Tax=Riccia fluitans TaxID=41844 RepID=A0ABD1XT13_9MARC
MAIRSFALHNISQDKSLLQDNEATWSCRHSERGIQQAHQGLQRASQQLKFEIRTLDNKERERAAVLSSLHDMESTSRALDEEEREIE